MDELYSLFHKEKYSKCLCYYVLKHKLVAKISQKHSVQIVKTTRYVIQNDASMYFENTLNPDVSVIISRPALSQENKKTSVLKLRPFSSGAGLIFLQCGRQSTPKMKQQIDLLVKKNDPYGLPSCKTNCLS